MKLKLSVMFPPTLNVPDIGPMPDPVHPVSLLMKDKGALLPLVGDASIFQHQDNHILLDVAVLQQQLGREN